MQTTVIYHSADYDGIFCREIARKFMPESELIGWNFGDKPLDRELLASPLCVLDLPLDKPFAIRFEDGWIARDNPIMQKEHRQIQPIDRWDSRNVTWIDHHKSAIESHPKDIPGYRIDGVAACRLAWQWFIAAGRQKEQAPGHKAAEWFWQNYPFPQNQDFVDRKVQEPLAILLAGEYDVWTRGQDGNLLPDLWEFQCGLRTLDALGVLDLPGMLETGSDSLVSEAISKGRIAAAYGRYLNAEMMKKAGFVLDWEGLRFLAINNEGCGSQRFALKDKPETGHDALLSFGYTGHTWVVSLYHAKHRTDLDLSIIAVKHGGGGHRGACGFTCNSLPFLPLAP